MRFGRDFIVLANWKMHKTVNQSIEYVRTLRLRLQEVYDAIEIILCVPFTVLMVVSREVGGSKRISVGAQDVHDQDWGAYTGEVSAPLLADAGCRYCMVGHSERREHFAETDVTVNRKAKALLKAQISPIVCIGETLDERERKHALEKLEEQLITCFDGFSPQDMSKTLILYEPIWAIGTGNIATPQQVDEACQFIRQIVQGLSSRETALTVLIVYGGSVGSDSAASMFNATTIDGVGVGTGSLDAESFLRIVRSCGRVRLNREGSSAAAREER